jgi:amino-acid N-acetyltransferase
MAILSSQATRRDAKSYFGRFGRFDKPDGRPSEKQSPTALAPTASSALIRTALVKLCVADTLSSNDLLTGLARTLVQLGRLGMPVCIVVEPEESYRLNDSFANWTYVALREKFERLIYRVVEAIEAQEGRALPLVGEPLNQLDSTSQSPEDRSSDSSSTAGDIKQFILNPKIGITPSSRRLLYNALKNGQIPVIAPLAGGINPSILPVSADSTLYRLCDALTAMEPATKNDTRNLEWEKQLPVPQISIERIIILDPAGGLPDRKRRGGSHVYINLQQEYHELVGELSNQYASSSESNLDSSKSHLRNLVLVDMCLALLGPTSSALVTTPSVAAAMPSQTAPQSLIHNLITDKPLISPSLPIRALRTPKSATTLLRRGLPVSVYRSIEPDASDKTPLDFPRLVQLIEDSFGRHLDVDHYKNRVRDNIASIIVAGDYEGAAVVTNETVTIPGSNSHVPYLDKFAVSSKSQGSGSVADIVFNVLISSFPDDLIWRSRKSNPVNKWVLFIGLSTYCSTLNELEELGNYLAPIGVYFGHHLTSIRNDSQSTLTLLVK